jgi:hypothetical protein
MSRFKSTRFDRVGDSIGYRGYEVGRVYTADPHLLGLIVRAPVAVEALDLVRSALSKFKGIEMSHAEFIAEVEGILQDYDSVKQ